MSLAEIHPALEKVASAIKGRGEFSVKSFFGGKAAYVDDKIFLTVTKIGFALKLPEPRLRKLMQEGAKPVRYFPRGHVKKQYALLSKTMLKDESRLTSLLEESVRYVLETRS